MDDASPTPSLISVVIPLYNEGLHVKELLSDLKKALQDSVLRQIEERTVSLDEQLPAGMSDEGNRRAQDRRRQEIMHKRKG